LFWTRKSSSEPVQEDPFAESVLVTVVQPLSE
jgi:hypothetical protein